ncbi:MAG: VOC family protein [Deltaproteobacteria bacterium]|nr:VOC family protein [Deltaproteobacteria bacterium]
MLKIRRINNTDILSNDPEKLSKWYHETLGLPYVAKWDDKVGIASLTAGDYELFFLKTNNPKHAPRRGMDLDNEPGGQVCFAFEVEDADQAVKDLGDKVEWASEVLYFEHPNKKGWSYRYAHFYDPDGNMLLVTEPRNMPELEADKSSQASDEEIRRVYSRREPLPAKR